ncbi:MAG: metallophosphoesterase [Vicinamibacterales bacterium]
MRVSRRTLLKALVGAGVGVASGVAADGFLYARHALTLTQGDVIVSGLPPALAGLRIGLLTDIHRGRWVSHDDVTAAVKLLMSAQPDLIVLGGDYVTFSDRDYVEPAAESLAALSAPHGVFAILGNHDDDRDTASALGGRGFEVLRDARTELSIRNEILNVAGIRFWTKKASEIAPVLRGTRGTTMLLAHDPRRLSEAAALGVPLVLSGHTHGGQVVLPVLGAVAAQKFPVVAGFARQAQTSLFVSRGVGTVYLPVRWNCPPEVAVLTLRGADAQTRQHS